MAVKLWIRSQHSDRYSDSNASGVAPAKKLRILLGSNDDDDDEDDDDDDDDEDVV